MRQGPKLPSVQMVPGEKFRESQLLADSKKNSEVRSLSEIAADQIIHLIVENGYQKGDKFDNEKNLCERLGVGRSTLREAVRMLASRNILMVKHGSGIYISDKLGIPDDPLGFTFIKDKQRLVRDLLDFRRIIEPPICALAAVRASVQQIDELEKLEVEVENLIHQGKPHLYADAAFHSKIGEMSGNIVMPKIEPIIFNTIDFSITATGSVLRDETIQDHRNLIDAIRSRDGYRASDAMLLHIIHNRDMITKIMLTESSKKAEPPVKLPA